MPQLAQINPNAKKVEICGLKPTNAVSVTPNANNAKLMPLLVLQMPRVPPLLLKDVGEPLPMELIRLANMPLLKLISLIPIKNLTRPIPLELPLP